MDNGEQSPTGGAMRRKVSMATVGIVGAAVLATGVVTAGLAYANGTDQLAATDGKTTTDGTTTNGSVNNGSTDDDTSTGDDSAAQQNNTGSLVSPNQAPAASGGSGHAQSGGS